MLRENLHIGRNYFKGKHHFFIKFFLSITRAINNHQLILFWYFIYMQINNTI
jgi:hypothetical protein